MRLVLSLGQGFELAQHPGPATASHTFQPHYGALVGVDLHEHIEQIPREATALETIDAADSIDGQARFALQRLQRKSHGLTTFTPGSSKSRTLRVPMTKSCAKALAASAYRAPQRAVFPVAGRNAKATIRGQLVNMRDGGFISDHDLHISMLIADVVCGGDVDAGSLVNEEYLMSLERKHFCALLEHPKSQERIMGMLQTGKPVRN